MSIQEQTIVRHGMRVDLGLRDFMVKVYGFMGLGLALSAIVAFGTASSPAMMRAIFGTPLQWVVLFAPLVMALLLRGRLHRISGLAAASLFVGYSGMMGLSLAWIFSVYTGSSIASVFGVSAAVFLSMGIYGYATKRDLTSMGSFLIMGVWGLIIASLVNLFLRNPMTDLMLSAVAVLIFTGLTAYDTQEIRLAYNAADGNEVSIKKAVLGALELYIDFINIFLNLLRLFGDRK